MKRVLFVIMAVVAIPLAMSAADRVVVLEKATGAWCTWCPSAAQGAEDLIEAHPGEVLVVAYHNGDPFVTAEGNLRISFYGVSGYPSAYFDGAIPCIGGSSSGTTFAAYENAFNIRKAVDAPLEITLERTYPSLFLGAGTATATIVNVSDKKVTGKFHFVVTESHIPYTWFNRTTMDHVMRDMVPDAQGVTVSVEAGETLSIDRSFTIDPDWPFYTGNVDNFELGCWVQTPDPSYPAEIYQAALTQLVPELKAEAVASKVDNEDGMLHPGETSDFLVTLKNTGEGPWETMSGVLSTQDTKVEIKDSIGNWGAAESEAIVENSTDPFQIKLKTGNPDGYRPELTLKLKNGMEQETEVSFTLFEPVAIKESGPYTFYLEAPAILQGQGAVALTLPSRANASLVLFDASGRQVKTLYSGTLNPGLNLLSVSTEYLPQGVYFLKATAGNQSGVERIVVLH